MITSSPTRRTALWAACAFALAFSAASMADDMASFATAGYASGLHSMSLMHKIDTDGDGMVSKDEWLAFHEKVFADLDKDKSGNVNAKEFISPTGGDLSGFSTGGFARGLRTKAMMHKIDTDGDGTVSHDEYIAYQSKVFDMMDTSTTHKGQLGKDMFATGGSSSH
jgi:Ca2+-binding EF-hand superfamily protein